MTVQTESKRGAQIERTMLSWNRAAIALAANGALLTRAGFVHHIVSLQTLGLAIALAGLALWLLSLARYTKIAGQPVPHLFGVKASAIPAFATFISLLSIVDLTVIIFAR